MKTSLIHNLDFALLTLLFIALPYPMAIFNIVLVVFCCVRFLFLRPDKFSKSHFVYAAIFGSLLIVEAFSLTYSTNFAAGLSNMEKRLAFLLLPMAILNYRREMSIKYIGFFTWVFIATMMIASVVLYLNAILKAIKVYLDSGWIELNFFTIEFTHLFDISHVYYGLYLAVAIILLLFKYTETTIRPSRNLFLTVLILFLLHTLLLITPKMAFIGGLVAAGYLVLRTSIPLKQLLIIVCFGVTSLLSMYLFIPNIQKRIDIMFDLQRIEVVNSDQDYVSTRIGPLLCSKELLIQNPIFGVGTGDYMDEMNKCYTSHGYDRLSNLNSHNQFLQSWVSLGLSGLVLTVLSLVWPFIRYGSSIHPVFGSILLLLMLSFLSESILERNKGIMLFTLLNSLLFVSFAPNKS